VRVVARDPDGVADLATVEVADDRQARRVPAHAVVRRRLRLARRLDERPRLRRLLAGRPGGGRERTVEPARQVGVLVAKLLEVAAVAESALRELDVERSAPVVADLGDRAA